MQPFRQTAAAADSVRDEAPLAPARDAAFDRQAGIIVRRLR
jgi:hypothetical protein